LINYLDFKPIQYNLLLFDNLLQYANRPKEILFSFFFSSKIIFRTLHPTSRKCGFSLSQSFGCLLT